MMNKSFFLSLCVLAGIILGMAASAHATVFFIDLNYSPLEVEQARNAAKLRGEDFVVVPDRSHYTAKQFQQLREAKVFAEQVHDETEKLSGRALTQKELNKLNADLEKKAKLCGPFNFSVEDIQKAMHSAPGSLSTVVASGHSNGVDYTGAFANTTANEISALLKSEKRSTEVKSIYLWGCYSVTGGESLLWKERLPNVNLVLGYETKADLGTDEKSGQVLGLAMKTEAKMQSENDSTKILAMLEKTGAIDKIHQLGMVNGACYYSAKDKKVTPLSELTLTCKSRVFDLSNQMKLGYSPYWRGDKSLANAGDDSSPLRQFYNEVQKNSQCLSSCISPEKRNALNRELGFSEGLESISADIPCPSQCIALIKFSHVIANYRRFYQSEIDALAPLLEKEPNMTPSCKNMFLSKATTRKEFFSAFDAGCTVRTANPQLQKKLSLIWIRMQSLLLDMNKVPLSWIEDNQHPNSPDLDDPDTFAPQSF